LKGWERKNAKRKKRSYTGVPWAGGGRKLGEREPPEDQYLKQGRDHGNKKSGTGKKMHYTKGIDNQANKKGVVLHYCETGLELKLGRE